MPVSEERSESVGDEMAKASSVISEAYPEYGVAPRDPTLVFRLRDRPFHRRLFAWRNGIHAPFCPLLSTAFVMKSIPSTPS